MRTWRLFVVLLVSFLALSIGAAHPRNQALPVGGKEIPELAAFDTAMQDFMAAREVKAGVLVIMKDNTVIYERSFGWKDREATIPLDPTALMRIASVSKPFTMAAIEQLIANGVMNRNDYAFCLGRNSGCWLTLEPFGTPDGQLQDITIDHLLKHEGGWNRDVSGDPPFKTRMIADALGVPSPAQPADVTRYMMGQPLDFTPGTNSVYSNFGYMVLGLIIEAASGKSYEAYIQDNLLPTLGIARSEVQLGRSLPEQRNPREPWYDSPFTTESVFPPYNTVSWTDGGWYLEGMAAHGGLITTGRSLVKFAAVRNGQGKLYNGGESWTWFGSLDGTFSMLRWRPDNVLIGVIFNRRDGQPTFDDIEPLMNNTADSITNWPTQSVDPPPVVFKSYLFLPLMVQ